MYATHSLFVLTYAELDLKNTKPVGVVGILLRILDILQLVMCEP